jgi:hypothetical protein
MTLMVVRMLMLDGFGMDNLMTTGADLPTWRLAVRPKSHATAG